jgi:glutathione S-transferase
MKPVLVTIPVSHYCEKARWALSWANIDFEERPNAPVFHVMANRKIGAGRTVPALATDDGVLPDSTDILRWIDARMPDDTRIFGDDPTGREAARLEEMFDEKLGKMVRRAAYGTLLPYPHVIRTLLTSGISGFQARAMGILFPVLLKQMVRSFKLTPSGIAEAEERIQLQFDQVAALLADGRPFLAGDRFTAADMTFCSLGAPMVMPEGYGGPLPKLESLPVDAQNRLRRWMDHPAGGYILRIYASHRHAKATSSILAP